MMIMSNPSFTGPAPGPTLLFQRMLARNAEDKSDNYKQHRVDLWWLACERELARTLAVIEAYHGLQPNADRKRVSP